MSMYVHLLPSTTLVSQVESLQPETASLLLRLWQIVRLCPLIELVDQAVQLFGSQLQCRNLCLQDLDGLCFLITHGHHLTFRPLSGSCPGSNGSIRNDQPTRTGHSPIRCIRGIAPFAACWILDV